MVNAAVYAGLLATTFSTFGQALVNLTIVPAVESVNIGDRLHLEWTTDTDYSLEFNFVEKETWGWSVAEAIFDDRIAEAGDGNYTFTIPQNADAGREYALWLSGTKLDGSGGWANLTNWFAVEVKKEELK